MAAPPEIDANAVERLPPTEESNAAERLEELLSYAGIRGGTILLVGADPALVAKVAGTGISPCVLSTDRLEAEYFGHLAERVDAAILFCALERTKDPLAALQKVREMLKPEGALMVISPTIDSRVARMLGSSWFEFSRKNLFYFSTDTLQSLLLRAGFGDPKITPDLNLVTLDHLKERLRSVPSNVRFRILRTLAALTPPFLRRKGFRTVQSRVRILVRSKDPLPMPRLSVIVPIFNERDTLVELLDALLAKTIEDLEIEVIIIESNSTDGSRELVLPYGQHPRVKLILQDVPRGKGFAVREGLKHATGDIVLFQDADLEYDLNDYEALIQPILKYRQNFVIGSRHRRNSWKMREFSDAPGLASFFNFGHLVFLTIFNTLYRQQLTDPFSMYKVFRRECLWGLNFECNRFDFDHEIVIKLLRKGYKVQELPVNYTSRSISEGKKVTIFRDPLTWLRALWKFRKSPLYS